MSRATDAYARLTAAMDKTAPACSGDDRFTADVISKSERDQLKQICDNCPLLELCADYARAAKPTAGYWAGITIKKRGTQ